MLRSGVQCPSPYERFVALRQLSIQRSIPLEKATKNPKWLLKNQPQEGGVFHTRNPFRCQNTRAVPTFPIDKKEGKCHQVTTVYFKSLVALFPNLADWLLVEKTS